MYCSRSFPHPRLCSGVLRTGWNTCALSSGVLCELRCPTQESRSPSFRFPLFPSHPHFFLSPAYLSVCQGTWGRRVIAWSSMHPKKLRILRMDLQMQTVCLFAHRILSSHSIVFKLPDSSFYPILCALKRSLQDIPNCGLHYTARMPSPHPRGTGLGIALCPNYEGTSLMSMRKETCSTIQEFAGVFLASGSVRS